MEPPRVHGVLMRNPELLQQKEDLRFTIAKRIIEAYASRLTTAQGTGNAIPLAMNEHVKKALASFQGRERDFFLSAYIRSGKYRAAIVKALRDAGLPEKLSWLPLIESGYKVTGAVKPKWVLHILFSDRPVHVKSRPLNRALP